MGNVVNVLHLSDLHFGVEADKKFNTDLAKRKNDLDALISKLKDDIPFSLKPDVVVISGDIGWAGNPEDYDKAKEWLTDLLKDLGLGNDKLIVCAGNHDIDRSLTITKSRPSSVSIADEWLKIENLGDFIQPFNAYNAFCKDFPIEELSIGDKKYSLIGTREVEGLRFIILNSAWFSRDEKCCVNVKDIGNLWIGLPHLDVMKSSSQLFIEKDKINIGVLHHPPSELNLEEIESYGQRRNTYMYLAERCHLILSGDLHACIRPADKVYNSAYLFINGATYSTENYRHNFSILQIDIETRELIQYTFEYNPSDGTWRDIDVYEYSLKKDTPTQIRVNEIKKVETKILDAIKNNDANKLKHLLEDINKPTLLKKMLNTTCKEGRTLLGLAAEIGCEEMVKLLIKKGAILKQTEEEAKKSIEEVAEEVFKLLKEKKGDKDTLAEVEKLLKPLEDNEVKRVIEERGDYGGLGWLTPLIIAAHLGYTDVVKLLLSKGANTSAKGGYGNTALHEASWHNRREVVELLIDWKAEIDAKDEYDRTPLSYASEAGSFEAVEILIEKGADINARNKNGWTPLFYASKAKKTRVEQLLRQQYYLDSLP